MSIGVLLASFVIVSLMFLRRKQLREAIEWIVKPRNIRRVLEYSLAIFIFLLAWNTITSLIEFVYTNNLNANEVNTGLFSTRDLSYGWPRFFGTAFFLYALGAFLLSIGVVFSFSKNSGDKSTESKDDPQDKYWHWLFLLIFIIGLVMPVYSIGVYPNVPQQVDGGRVVQVKEVVTLSDKLNHSFSGPAVEVYFIDRTSKSSLFLLSNKQQQSQRVIEVANSRLQSITYNFP